MIGLLEQQQQANLPSHFFDRSVSPIASFLGGAGSASSSSALSMSPHHQPSLPARGLRSDLCCTPRLILGTFLVAVALLFGLAGTSALYSRAGVIGGGYDSSSSSSSSSSALAFWQSRSSDPRHDSSHRVLAHPERPASALEEHEPEHDGTHSLAAAKTSVDRNNSSSTAALHDTESGNSSHNSFSSSSSNSSSAASKTIFTDWYLVEGRIRLRMRPDAAPQTVANMLRLIRSGAFNRTGCFYRYERSFVLQGGLCSKSDHKTVPLEAKLPNKKWACAIARSSSPHSGGSEWFINLGHNRGLDKKNGGYAVFAEVVDGFDVVKKLSQHPTHSSAGINKKTGKRKRGGLMLFNKPVPHFLGVVVVDQ